MGLEKMGDRHAPAAGALGAAHVLDAGEGHGEGSGGHVFGVRVERVSSRACVEMRAPIVARLSKKRKNLDPTRHTFPEFATFPGPSVAAYG